MSLFLPKADIATFTGERTRKAQMQELSRKGIAFDTNSRGDILVLRSVIEQRLAGRAERRHRGHNIQALLYEKSTV